LPKFDLELADMNDILERHPALLPVILFFLAFLVFATPGFFGFLFADDSIVLYSSQGVALGIPPYVNSFLVKGPLPSLIGAVGIKLGQLLGASDVSSSRALFCFFAALSAPALYVLTKDLVKSKWAGILAVLALLSYPRYHDMIYWGPRAKVLLVVFETLCLLYIYRQRWFYAGIFASFCALVWQPMAIFCLVTILSAGLRRSNSGPGALAALGSTLLGISLPLAATFLYFGYYGAIADFFHGYLLIHIGGVHQRGDFALMNLRNLFFEHLWSSAAMITACGGIFLLFVSRIIQGIRLETFSKWLRNESFLPLFLSFFGLVIWSAMDYQGPPDSFCFIPHLAVIFAVVVYYFSNYASLYLRRTTLSRFSILPAYVISVMVVILVLQSSYTNRFRYKGGLDLQISRTNNFIAQFGQNPRILCLGKANYPCILSVESKRSPNRYLFFDTGIMSLMDQIEPGGFDGWMQKMIEYDPHLIYVRRVYGEHSRKLSKWIHGNYTKVQDSRHEMNVLNKDGRQYDIYVYVNNRYLDRLMHDK